MYTMCIPSWLSTNMIVISVNKRQKVTDKGAGGQKRWRFNKKCWKMLYFDDQGKFRSRYIKGLDVYRFKLMVQKLKTFECSMCALKFRSNKDKCPNCK